eukprot:1153054-Pelagomonas_calceolata.AAC.2
MQSDCWNPSPTAGPYCPPHKNVINHTFTLFVPLCNSVSDELLTSKVRTRQSYRRLHLYRRSPSPSSNDTPVVVMCGNPEVYEPPDQLSILVQDAFECLSQVSMPPQFWALDVRLVPPYALTLPSEEAAMAGKLEAGAVDERSAWGAGGIPLLQSTAARRVYGPVPPPPR